MNEPHARRRSPSRGLVPALLLLSAVPVLAGAYRLAMIAGLVAPGEGSARLLPASPSLAVHIVATGIFLVVGALQVAPHLRARSPRAHRAAGWLAAPSGLVAALSGLWLTLTLPPGPLDGEALLWIRVGVGTTMAFQILVGVAALGKKAYATHGAWMIRAYALGLGAGTQVLTHVAMRLAGASATTDNRTIAMAGAWLLNALVAEWIVRRAHASAPARAERSVAVRGRGDRARLLVSSALVVPGTLAFAGSARAEDAVPPNVPSESAPAPRATVSTAPEAPASTSTASTTAPATQPSTSTTTPASPSTASTTTPAPHPSTPPATPSPRPAEGTRAGAREPAGGAGPVDASKWRASPGSGILGLRVTYVRADSGAIATDAASATFGGRLEAHNEEATAVVYRGQLDFSLGGGSAGVDGALGGALLVGLRLPITAHHAPFARVGFGGEIQGNQRSFYSRFDLPLTEVGHQYVSGDLLVEAGARFSPVLTGRFRTNTDVRVLSSNLSFGAFAAAQLSVARVDLLYTRIAPRDGVGQGLDSFQGLGCILPFRELALCADGQLVRADFTGPSASPLTGGYIGGLIGVGRVNGSGPR